MWGEDAAGGKSRSRSGSSSGASNVDGAAFSSGWTDVVVQLGRSGAERGAGTAAGAAGGGEGDPLAVEAWLSHVPLSAKGIIIKARTANDVGTSAWSDPDNGRVLLPKVRAGRHSDHNRVGIEIVAVGRGVRELYFGLRMPAPVVGKEGSNYIAALK